MWSTSYISHICILQTKDTYEHIHSTFSHKGFQQNSCEWILHVENFLEYMFSVTPWYGARKVDTMTYMYNIICTYVNIKNTDLCRTNLTLINDI